MQKSKYIIKMAMLMQSRTIVPPEPLTNKTWKPPCRDDFVPGIWDTRHTMSNECLRTMFENDNIIDELFDKINEMLNDKYGTIWNKQDKYIEIFIRTFYKRGTNESHLMRACLRYIFDYKWFLTTYDTFNNHHNASEHIKKTCENEMFSFQSNVCQELYINTDKYSSMNKKDYVERKYAFDIFNYVVKKHFSILFGCDMHTDNFCDVINNNSNIVKSQYEKGRTSGKVLLRLTKNFKEYANSNDEQLLENIEHSREIINGEFTRIANMFNNQYFTNIHKYFANKKIYSDTLNSDTLNSDTLNSEFNWNSFSKTSEFIFMPVDN
jgi:hypothetical protein